MFLLQPSAGMQSKTREPEKYSAKERHERVKLWATKAARKKFAGVANKTAA
jgi:hypothetical protein